MSGSIRENVDPRNDYSDEEVQHALEAASLQGWNLHRHINAARVLSKTRLSHVSGMES